MSAPELTRLLALEARVDTQDGGGGRAAEWVTLGSHWAEVRPSAAAEGFFGGVESSRVTHRVMLRWSPFGAPSRPVAHQRLRDGARTYDILGVTEADARNAWLIAWVREGGPQ